MKTMGEIQEGIENEKKKKRLVVIGSKVQEIMDRVEKRMVKNKKDRDELSILISMQKGTLGY